MPDIVTVSDSILNLSAKIRLATDSITVSESVTPVITHIPRLRPITENTTISDSIVIQQAKQRIIQQTTTITEDVKAYLNGVEIVPPIIIPTEVPTPQDILGTRERAVRATRRAPRAIVIDEVKNTAIAPLKLLAFSQQINKALVGIRPRLIQNAVLTPLALSGHGGLMRFQASSRLIVIPDIKTQPRVKARLALQSSSRSMWATALGRLKLRPEIQRIESLKAINADRIDKLHKLATIAMMVDNL